jgi:multiple sugar transport system substrate-binding protein
VSLVRQPARVAAALTLSGCLLVSGCTTSSRPPDAGPSPSASPSASSTAPVTLRFGVYGDPVALASYDALARAYHRDHPNVTIKVEHTSTEAAALTRLDRQFAEGTPPDLFLVQHEALPAFVAAGQVQPVDELLEKRGVLFGDNYQLLGLAAFSADSALQCMPHDVSPLVVFYNKRLLHFRDLVPPGQQPPTRETGWTWEQFTAAAKQMSHDGVKGVYAEPALQTLLPLVRSAGSDIVDDPRLPTTLTMSDGATRAALEKILEVLSNPRLSPTPDELARAGAVKRFEDGRIGMLFGTRALVPRLRDAAGLRFDVFPLPSLGSERTVADMTGYCISADTPHVQAAADFLTFASGETGATITAAFGEIVPASLPALHSKAFEEPGRDPRHAQVFGDSMRRADAPPFVPEWPDVVQQTRPLVEQLFYMPVLDLDTLLARMDTESQAILAQPSESPSP